MNRRIRKKTDSRTGLKMNFSRIDWKKQDTAKREYWQEHGGESTRYVYRSIFRHRSERRNNTGTERRNYSNRLHKHWLHDTRTHWKIHVPHAYN